MKKILNEIQYEFVFKGYLNNFIEQNEINVDALTFDQKIDRIFSDAELSPSFSNYLLVQIQALIFNENEAIAMREDFFVKNN